MYQKALFVLTYLFFSFVVGNVTEKGGGSSEFSAVFAYAETACFDSCDVSVCPPATDAQAVSTDKCLFAGAEYSGAIIGIQMASAYVGSTFMPPLFGLLGSLISFRILPVYLAVFIILMITMTELTFKITAKKDGGNRS